MSNRDSPLSECRVLLVEDHPADLFIYQTTLARAGADVHTAGDGESAVAAVQAGPRFHVAVVDLVLPGMRGTELVSLLRSGGFRGALVGLSAFLTDEIIEQWYAAGCDAVLPKDRGTGEIVRMVVGLCQAFDRP